MPLSYEFYNKDTVEVAKNLLGKKVVHNIEGHILSGFIVETEAYLGINDTACHSYKGKTGRTSVMFENGGLAYIYMIYGMYYMFNIVTERKGIPCAVLIRAIEPLENICLMEKYRKTKGKNITNGPGKLCQALKIDKTLNAENLIESKKLYIDKYLDKNNFEICSGTRIGINYANEKDKNALLRFWIKDNMFVSKK
jgi:DNA-3-methyladenine glycosylase